MATRILIADDHELVRGALRAVLESAGPWEVLEAQDGEQALTQAQNLRPDLIILDLAMPVLDGFSAIAILKRLLPDTPILVHTLYFSPLVVRKALKAGAQKVVPKSNSAMIVATVRDVLQPKAQKDRFTTLTGLVADLAEVAPVQPALEIPESSVAVNPDEPAPAEAVAGKKNDDVPSA